MNVQMGCLNSGHEMLGWGRKGKENGVLFSFLKTLSLDPWSHVTYRTYSSQMSFSEIKKINFYFNSHILIEHLIKHVELVETANVFSLACSKVPAPTVKMTLVYFCGTGERDQKIMSSSFQSPKSVFQHSSEFN